MENRANGVAAVSHNGVACNGNSFAQMENIVNGVSAVSRNGVASNGHGVACNCNSKSAAVTVEDDLSPLRRLQITDKSKGFVELLAQLSPTVTPLSDDDFRKRFEELEALGNPHLIIVAEDCETGRIVATGSVYVEQKFTHGGGLVGHIEDVVVDAAARGRRLGQRVVHRLTDHAKAMGCYKVILDCRPDRKAFYEKCGFTEKNIQMTEPYFV